MIFTPVILHGTNHEIQPLFSPLPTGFTTGPRMADITALPTSFTRTSPIRHEAPRTFFTSDTIASATRRTDQALLPHIPRSIRPARHEASVHRLISPSIGLASVAILYSEHSFTHSGIEPRIDQLSPAKQEAELDIIQYCQEHKELFASCITMTVGNPGDQKTYTSLALADGQYLNISKLIKSIRGDLTNEEIESIQAVIGPGAIKDAQGDYITNGTILLPMALSENGQSIVCITVDRGSIHLPQHNIIGMLSNAIVQHETAAPAQSSNPTVESTPTPIPSPTDSTTPRPSDPINLLDFCLPASGLAVLGALAVALKIIKGRAPNSEIQPIDQNRSSAEFYGAETHYHDSNGRETKHEIR